MTLWLEGETLDRERPVTGLNSQVVGRSSTYVDATRDVVDSIYAFYSLVAASKTALATVVVTTTNL